MPLAGDRAVGVALGVGHIGIDRHPASTTLDDRVDLGLQLIEPVEVTIEHAEPGLAVADHLADPAMQKIRYLDEQIDDLGRARTSLDAKTRLRPSGSQSYFRWRRRHGAQARLGQRSSPRSRAARAHVRSR